jgi:hypothetical protein
MGSKWFLALILILPLSVTALGQNSADDGAPPLGDLAKKNKCTDKTKAKKVFTDDDMEVRNGPIPAIALQGPDNIGAILDVIHELKRTHDAAETEQLVHEWYDKEAEVLSTAIDNNVRNAEHNQVKMEAAQDRYAYGNGYPYGYGNGYGQGYDYESDYKKMQQHQLSERWSQRSDARNTQENWQTIARIQQAFVRIRCDVLMNRGKVPYDWFRIRNASGIGSY